MYDEYESNDTYYVDDNEPITNEIIEEITDFLSSVVVKISMFFLSLSIK